MVVGFQHEQSQLVCVCMRCGGRDLCLEQKIMRECEEEESNVIVMGSFLVESIRESAKSDLENGCGTSGV